MKESTKTHFILEILAPKKTIIRELASDSYLENNNLSRLAIDRYIRGIKETDEWANITTFADPLFEAQKLLNEKFFVAILLKKTYHHLIVGQNN
ncbi:hypothetical protein [Ureibacillus acetophenoni]